MQRKTSAKTKAVLIFMGFLVLLPFIAVFAAVVPGTANAPAQHVATAPVQHAQHAEPSQVQPTAHPKLPARMIQHVRNKVTTYVVKTGDTLWAIAIHFHIKGGWPTLYHANAHTVGSNPNLIYPGQHLTITQQE
jgi:resuscitation-promoting factor RpfA